MKKLLVLSAAILFAFTMNAQKIGVKAGYGMSGYLINFWSPAGSTLATGLNAGLVGEYPVNDMMSLRLDIGLNQLGSDYDSKNDVTTESAWPFTAVGVDYNTETTVNYLNIGVSPKFNFGPAYVFVGPYFAYAVSGTKKAVIEGTSSIGYPVAGTASIDIFSDPAVWDVTKEYSDTNNSGGKGDLYNKMDIGFNLGVGANFSGVFVELNAGLGLMNFINTSSTNYVAADYVTKDNLTTPITGDATQKNIFFGLSVGYLFDFAK